MFTAAFTELKVFVGRLSVMPSTVFVTAGISLFLYQYYGGSDFFEHVWAPHTSLAVRDVEAAGYFYWFGSAFVLLALLPHLVVRCASRLAPEDPVPSLGWGVGDWRFGLGAVAVCTPLMLVVVALVSRSPGFYESYPLFPHADRSARMLLAYEAAYAVYFVAWEFFFRGFMTFSLEKTLGIWTVFVQMLPFVVMHFGKPDLEAFSSVFGGIALGYVALRSRSIWYGVLIHAGVAVAMDLMAIVMKGAHG